MKFRKRLRGLYEADTRRGHRFRYGLLIFDLTTVLFIVTTSFLPRSTLVSVARCDVRAGHSRRFPGAPYHVLASAARVSAALDLCGHRGDRLVSGAAGRAKPPASCASCGRCGCCTATRFSRRLRADFPFFNRNEDAIIAATNLAVFIFIMTGVVYETQHEQSADQELC